MEPTVKILDVVALLNNIPEHGLLQGQVGTIVEQLADSVYEVEFCNNKGETIASLAIEATDFLKLHYEVGEAA